MENLNKVLLIMSTLFFVNCNNGSKQVPETLFNVQNLNNIIIESFEDDNLNKQGYFREVEDVIIFNKNVKDTITQLQFDNDSGKILYKTWYIKIDSTDRAKTINKILRNHNVLELNSFGCIDKKDYSYFPVVSDDNNLFLCHVNKDDKNYYLNITYYNPVVKRK
jgi:hypothetical protein